MNLANIVEEGAGEQQVAVNLRIIAGNQIAKLEQRDHVIQQSSDKSMVQGLSSRSGLVSQRNFRVGHESLEQRAQIRILHARNKVYERAPKLIDIFRGLGKVIGKI